MIKHNKNFASVPYIYPMYGETFGPGVVENEIFSGNLVRFKAIGNTTFKIINGTSEIVMSDGETDYFFIPEGNKITILTGSLNLAG